MTKIKSSIILDNKENERREIMGFKVKEIRLAKNISQEELSKASGVSRQTISDLESGEVVNTTTSTLAKLADALECKVGDIFCP